MKKNELEDYYKGARSFDYELRQRSDHSRRLAWVVAGCATAAATAACVALAALAPLKTVEPFVIRVDSSTGVPEVMTSLSDGQQEYDEAVTKYFLARYVRTREGYNFASREAIFNEVQILSSDQEDQEFSDYFNASNPDSPQFRYGRNGKAEVQIRSISFVDDNVAQVRYNVVANMDGETTTTPWLSTIQFAYRSDAVISNQDRLINPLGFVVLNYRSDPEVVQ